MELNRDDEYRILVTLNDLYLEGLLLPSQEKRLALPRFEATIPHELRQFVGLEIERIIGLFFFIRIGKNTTTVTEFIHEMSDLIFQLVRHDFAGALRGARLSRKDPFASCTALALYAKELGLTATPPLLWQRGEEIRSWNSQHDPS